MSLAPVRDLDDLDRRIVVALQRDGRASWRTVADAVGSSVATVSRRGQRLLADGTVRVAVVPALGSAGEYQTYWCRINCAPGRSGVVAAQLSAEPDVRFCAMVTGEYDLIAELVLRGGAAGHLPVLERLRAIPGVVRWRSDIVLHVHKVSFDWGAQLLGEAPRDGGDAPPADCGPEHFDEADEQILAALHDDGRESFQRIAEGLGMHESSVRRRFDRMVSARCVDVLTLVPSAALGMEAEVLLTVAIAPSQLAAVAAALAREPSVRFLASLLDSNAMLCEVIAGSVGELNAFITGTLAHLHGVEGWTASMELAYLKRGFVATPWWHGAAEEPRPVVSAAG